MNPPDSNKTLKIKTADGDDLFINQWFTHGVDDFGWGLEGRVIDSPEPGWYLIELFDSHPLYEAGRIRKLVRIGDVKDWTFHPAPSYFDEGPPVKNPDGYIVKSDARRWYDNNLDSRRRSREAKDRHGMSLGAEVWLTWPEPPFVVGKGGVCRLPDTPPAPPDTPPVPPDMAGGRNEEMFPDPKEHPLPKVPFVLPGKTELFPKKTHGGPRPRPNGGESEPPSRQKRRGGNPKSRWKIAFDDDQPPSWLDSL